MLRLIGTEERVPRGSLPPEVRVRGAPSTAVLTCLLVGVVAGACLVGTLLVSTAQVGTPLYKRTTASTLACEAAGLEISTLRRATFFTDDCSAPIVTPVLGQEGYVIISRIAEGHADDDDGGPVRYSVKLDGRAIDKWHTVEVKRAPNHLTLDASLLPTAASALPKSAQR